eukprot:tig00021068_g17800.t1
MESERETKRARTGEATHTGTDGSGGDSQNSRAPSHCTGRGTGAAAGAVDVAGSVEAAMAAGGSPFDALPDELATRIIGQASASESSWLRELDLIESSNDVVESSHSSASDQDDEDLELQLSKLVQLSHVCRRFRSLAQQPSLWRHIHINQASNASVAMLLQRPEKQRKALRSLSLRGGTLSIDGFKQICKVAGSQLTALRLIFGDALSPHVLTGLSHFPNLRQLRMDCESDTWLKQNIQEMTGPLVQGALRTAESLPLEILDTRLPLLPKTLQSLVPLASTLRHLSVVFCLEENGSPAPAFSAVAAFKKLKHLSITAFNRQGQSMCRLLRTSQADSEALSGLFQLRAYWSGILQSDIGFLGGMKQLRSVFLTTTQGVDFSPLLSVAGSLQSAAFFLSELNDASAASLASVVPQLSNLETLDIYSSPRSFISVLAQQPLKQLTFLRKVAVACVPNSAAGREAPTVPGAFLKRLSTDVPSLKKLALHSPLPFPEEMEAVASLGRLRGLQLVLCDKAPAALDAPSRGALELLLLHTKTNPSIIRLTQVAPPASHIADATLDAMTGGDEETKGRILAAAAAARAAGAGKGGADPPGATHPEASPHRPPARHPVLLQFIPPQVEFEVPPKGASFGQQLALFSRRAALLTARNSVNAAVSLLVGILCGLAFLRIGNDLVSIQNRAGLFFFSSVFVSFASLSSLETLAAERLVFVRERAAGSYSPLAYFLTKVLFDIVPLRLFPALLFGLPLYFISGLSYEAGRFFVFLCALCLLYVCVVAICLVVSSAAPSPSVASAVAGITLLLALFFGGSLVQFYSIKPWLRWVPWLSPFRYAFEIWMTTEFQGSTVSIAQEPLPSVSISGELLVSATFGLAHETVARNFVALALMAAFHLAAAFAAILAFARERR